MKDREFDNYLALLSGMLRLRRTQREGIAGIWIDARGRGVPAGHDVRPHRIIERLSDLRREAR